MKKKVREERKRHFGGKITERKTCQVKVEEFKGCFSLSLSSQFMSKKREKERVTGLQSNDYDSLFLFS